MNCLNIVFTYLLTCMNEIHALQFFHLYILSCNYFIIKYFVINNSLTLQDDLNAELDALEQEKLDAELSQLDARAAQRKSLK